MATQSNNVTVPLTPDLRAFVVRRAKEEERSMSWIVRRLIASAMRAEDDQRVTKHQRAAPATA